MIIVFVFHPQFLACPILGVIVIHTCTRRRPDDRFPIFSAMRLILTPAVHDVDMLASLGLTHWLDHSFNPSFNALTHLMSQKSRLERKKSNSRIVDCGPKLFIENEDIVSGLHWPTLHSLALHCCSLALYIRHSAE